MLTLREACAARPRTAFALGLTPVIGLASGRPGVYSCPFYVPVRGSSWDQQGGPVPKLTVNDRQQMKLRGEKIRGLVCYDHQLAQIADQAGADIVSVGDSPGRYVLGHQTHHEITMDQMVLFCSAVSSGVKRDEGAPTTEGESHERNNGRDEQRSADLGGLAHDRARGPLAGADAR